MFDGFPFIMQFLALGQANFNFCKVLFIKKKTEGNYGVTFLFDLGLKLFQLTPVQ